MSTPDRPTCVVREFPLPEREYRVSPRRPGRRTVRPRRSPLPALALAGLLLFGCGFLLGLRAAAQEETSPPVPKQAVSAGGGQASGGDSSNGVHYLGMPADEDISGEDISGEDVSGGALPAEDSPAEDAWKLLLVNGDHPLPEDFSVPERTDLGGGHSIDSRVYPYLQQMLEDARAAGYKPLICSSFRTGETQEKLFANKVQRLKDQGYGHEEAEREAAMWVARPGTSEHQAALAVDIVDMDYQLLDQAQEDRPVQRWLMENCAEYGFILRYPTGKSTLTGVGYEPWHYRYVGQEAARAIMEAGICLEEYLA